MNWRAIRAIVRKDLKVVAQNKGVMLPLIIVPALMLVVMPAVFALAPAMATTYGAPLQELDAFVSNMPAGLQAELAQYTEEQAVVVLGLLYFLAPFFLMIPLMVANVIAADSFAGEKERKTLEALLYTPVTDRELIAGKMLSAWLPALAVSLLGFLLYGTVANAAAWPVMGRLFFPNWTWLVLLLWVAPAAAGLGLGAMVVVSSRAQGFQDAYQLGGVVVLPVLLLVIGQVTGVMYFHLGMVLLLGLVLWLVDAAILWYGARTFQRAELIARL